jgi:hypothetical protein
MRKLIIVLLFAFPAVVQAGAWCHIRDTLSNCNFNDKQSCWNAVASRGGDCMPNPRELGVSGDATYCVITDGKKQCTYRMKSACLIAAAELMGGCVRNADKDLRRGSKGKDLDFGCEAGDMVCASERRAQ